MSSVTRTGGTNQPAVDLDSPPKLRRSSRDNRQSSSRRTNNGASTKSRRQERDATPRVRNIKADDVPSSDHYMYYDSHHSRRGRLERSKYYVSEEDEDEDEDSTVDDSYAEETQSEASSGTCSSGYGSSAASSNGSGDDNDEESAEDAYARSIAAANRRMRQDDYGVVKPGVGAGWPKKSLLEASSSRIDGASFSGARVGATANEGGPLHAGSLKQARANAVARRNITTKKLKKQQKQKQKELQRTTTPKSTKKESAESPDTATTTSTTMSALSPLSTADLSPPPPSAARAYNRFFPPKLVESNDVLGADKVLSLDPNAETGEIEVYTEEKYYTTTSSTNPRSEASYESYGASQWALIAELAKKECEPGAGLQQQYHDEKDETFSLASLPTVLNDGDVFHESAAKAVASLLSLPRHKRHRNRGGDAYVATENGEKRNGGGDDDASSVAASALSGFSAYSTYSTYSATINNRELGGVAEHEEEEGVPDGAPLVSEETEEFVNSIPSRMLQPNKQIYDLIAVIHIGEDDASSKPLTTAATRGAMTRRMNACGSVKLLTAKSATACVRLAWTAGVLSSLTSVLYDSPFNYVDKATYDAYTVARKRTIAALIAMSDAKENRILMLHSPGLVHSLIKTIDEADDGQCKLGCSRILTHLSKEVENRLLLAKTPGLVETLLETILQKENDIDNLYESSPNKDLYATKANAFAIFLNLAKEEHNAHYLARNKELVEALVTVSKLHNSLLHTPTLATILHLSRHRENAKLLVLQTEGLLPSLVLGMNSPDATARRHAVRAIQNLSSNRPCRPHIIPSTRGLIERLCKIALGNASAGKDEEDGGIRHAAVGTLNNLADEPANLIPMTNVPDCFPALMLIAHGGSTGITPVMSMMAKDALAASSDLLVKVATKAANDKSKEQKISRYTPSAKSVTYNQWK